MENVTWSELGRDMATKRFFKDLWHEIQQDNIFDGAAALAYYWMLAIFPGAIFLLSLLPYLPVPNLHQAIMDLLRQSLPSEAADLFTGVVNGIVSQRRGGLLSFGFIFTIWSASKGLSAAMQQLNITYDVEEERPFWKFRGTALMLMLMFVVLIIGAFVLIISGGILQDWFGSIFGRSRIVLTGFALLRWIIIMCLLLSGLALIYYFGPNVDQKFQFITPGSVIGIIVLVISTLGFQLYISNFANYNASYGSLGGVIILMLWLYLTGLIILLGSEINALLEHYHPEGKTKGEKRLD